MKYEKWSLGYWCLKQYVRFADWIIHKKTIVTGKEKIPKNKPILFAPNHQNALSDPMAVLLNTSFQPVWLARADIFKNKTTSKFLKFLKIMPVYRLRDGKENLAKNDETFAQSIKVLEHNFALALFPEAGHSGKRQMLLHKKAVPRIVFMAEEKTNNNLDIHIIPTGIYYSNYWKFDRNLIVNYGDPIKINSYLEEYKENPGAAILSLRKKLYESINPLVIDIRSKVFYTEIEKLREIFGKYFLKKQHKKYSVLNLFHSDQILVNKFTEIESENLEEFKNLIKEADNYETLIRKYKLRSWLIENQKNNMLKIFINKLTLLFGLPVFIFGFAFNAVPFFLIDFFIRKKVKNEGFWSTFFLGSGIIIFPLFYILELILFSWILTGLWLKIAFLVSLPIAGKLAFKWYILCKKTVGRARLLFLKLFNKKIYLQLLNEKDILFNHFEKLIAV